MARLSGGRMLTGPVAVIGVLASLAVMSACQAPPVTSPRTGAAVLDDLAEARQAMRHGDHTLAASRLRLLLTTRPDSLEVHYLLAVSASHLDRDEEALREFQWVIDHADPGSTEAAIAREWLAGRMTRVAALAPQRTAPPGVVEGTPEQRPELASVSGKVVGPAGPRARVLLFLKGVPGASVEDEAHSLRSDRNGHYRFDNVKPGEYMLTDAVAGPVTWRVRVPLARAERRVLDLSPANHAAVRDDFPDYRR